MLTKCTFHYKKDCTVKKSPTRISIGHTHGMLHDKFEYIILQINTKEFSSIFYIIELPHRGFTTCCAIKFFYFDCKTFKGWRHFIIPWKNGTKKTVAHHGRLPRDSWQDYHGISRKNSNGTPWDTVENDSEVTRLLKRRGDHSIIT